eukprot:TRINITY_DN6257_c0_g1_i2.p1 TRINITY_DN6257_c0_g1~~TRINITY_DN6257_c0_g1_i2.p1  ORF type:complete len:228 (+),score=30.96 TRINITY_DN6257_c0_g1_i2:40-723(+)
MPQPCFRSVPHHLPLGVGAGAIGVWANADGSVAPRFGPSRPAMANNSPGHDLAMFLDRASGDRPGHHLGAVDTWIDCVDMDSSLDQISQLFSSPPSPSGSAERPSHPPFPGSDKRAPKRKRSSGPSDTDPEQAAWLGKARKNHHEKKRIEQISRLSRDLTSEIKLHGADMKCSTRLEVLRSTLDLLRQTRLANQQPQVGQREHRGTSQEPSYTSAQCLIVTLKPPGV